MTQPELMTLLCELVKVVESDTKLIKVMDGRLRVLEQLALDIAETIDEETAANVAKTRPYLDIFRATSAAKIAQQISQANQIIEKLRNSDILDIMNKAQEDSTNE